MSLGARPRKNTAFPGAGSEHGYGGSWAGSIRLGDFYVGMIPRFTDPARMSEYKGGDTYAAG